MIHPSHQVAQKSSTTILSLSSCERTVWPLSVGKENSGSVSGSWPAAPTNSKQMNKSARTAPRSLTLLFIASVINFFIAQAVALDRTFKSTGTAAGPRGDAVPLGRYYLIAHERISLKRNAITCAGVPAAFEDNTNLMATK